MDMSETRQGFQLLTSELLGQLGLEVLNKTLRDIAGKAQVTVDIVIRNLFERTADIGFLATDDDIRTFLKGAAQYDAGDDDPKTSAGPDTSRLVARFREYVAKYSVYFNIILLDPSGRVLVQLDEGNQVERSSDPLIQQALSTTAEFVESYRHSDLLPSAEQSLIYAYRVTETNEARSRPLGVLCLCFRFHNEMQGVFQNLRKPDDWAVLTLLDKTGKVIASSDEHQVPRNVTMEIDLKREFGVIRFAGRQYLAKTCATKGYQGFFGLGWYGHAMIPIEHAFDQHATTGLNDMVSEDVLEEILQDSRLFSERLRSIPVQADRIQDELERTVWNGNVRESDAQSKVLLWNISDAGARTKRVFEESIGNLHETVVSGIMNSVEFQASLAVDIMDRNLYERANDCRWWALTSDFRRILAQQTMTERDAAHITDILAYINGLYTVYSNLFIYDSRGTVVAVSNQAERGLVGTTLQTEWVHQTLSLKDSQSYSVSDFAATPLYGDQFTYIYGAAITDPANSRRCVGGIGIVFDSTPQFREMLRDSLLRNESGGVVDGCFGVLADRNGVIISSTEEEFAIGTALPVSREFLQMPVGGSHSGIVELNGYYYALGARTSSGYREYKVNDRYQNDVVGMIFMPVAQVVAQQTQRRRQRDINSSADNSRDTGDVVELATFYIGEQWFGVRAEKVCVAIRAERVHRIPHAARFVLGNARYDDKLITVIDLPLLLDGRSSQKTNLLVAVVRAGDEYIGLAVDRLGQIPAVSQRRMEPVNLTLESNAQYLECMVKPAEKAQQHNLLLVIDPDELVRSVVKLPESVSTAFA